MPSRVWHISCGAFSHVGGTAARPTCARGLSGGQSALGQAPRRARHAAPAVLVDAQRRRGMSRVRASSVHDDWVEAVKTEDCEVVSRLDGVWVNSNLLCLSFFHVSPHSSLLQESDVGLLHVLGDVGSDDRDVRVSGNTSNEGLHKVPHRLERLNDSFAEGEGLNAALADVSLCLWSAHVEGNLLLAAEEEHLRVGNLGVSEEDGVAAEKRLRLARRDQHLKLRVRELGILESDLFEALALVGCLWVSLGDVSREDGKEGASRLWSAIWLSGVASPSRWWSVRLLEVLVGLGGPVEVLRLLAVVVHVVDGRGSDDGLDVLVVIDGLLDRASHVVLLDGGADEVARRRAGV